MSMTLPAIADAVAARLNDAAFNVAPAEFEAVRVYLPANDLVKLATTALQVLVFASGDEVSVLSRQDQLEEPRVSVGVIRKLDPRVDPTTPAGNAAIDLLVNLCRLIALSYGPGTFLDPSAQQTLWVDSKYPLVFDPVEMRTNRIFLGVITFKFQQSD
jgi:hypothetical protein